MYNISEEDKQKQAQKLQELRKVRERIILEEEERRR
jgi:hypothetical protein